MSFAEFAAKKLVPGAFREFLPFVSPSGLRVIHKEKVLALALKCATRTLNQESYSAAFAAIQTVIRQGTLQELVEISSDTNRGIPLSQYLRQASEADKTLLGEMVLRLYFTMIKSRSPFFLDLRPQHFRWDPQANLLLWSPSRLWLERSEFFFERVNALYIGFFDGDEAATRAGLELYAWETEATAGFAERIEGLMRKHFGDANSQAVRFAISRFKETFHLVFEEAIASKTRFHPELAFLGTALAGLYLTLEQIQVPIDVAKCYRATPAAPPLEGEKS